jgi:hypothetical protein
LKRSPEDKNSQNFDRDSKETIEPELGEKSFRINPDRIVRSKEPRNKMNGDNMIFEHPTIEQRHQEAIITSVVFKLTAQSPLNTVRLY